MDRFSFHVVAAAAVVAGFTATQASAAWVETFTTGSNSSYDQQWLITTPFGSVNQSIDNGYLELTGSAMVAMGLVTTETFTDVIVSGWVNAAGTGSGTFAAQTDHLLLARFDGTTGSGYGLVVNYELENISLEIAKIAGFAPAGGLGGSRFVDGAGVDTDLRLWAELSVFGDVNPVVSARIFDAPGGTLLDSLSWTDTTGDPFTSGYSGIAALPNSSGGSYIGTFDSIRSVPEPGTLLLLASGALMMASRRRGETA